MNNKMTIYISSPYSYKDVFDIFLVRLRRYWSTLKYPILLSTNYEAQYKDVYVYNSDNNNDTWVERTIPAVKEISSEYIMVLCDDLFLNRTVDSRRIDELLDFMKKNSICYCRLKPNRQLKKIQSKGCIGWLNKKTPYGINLQRGIFKKSYLLDLLEDGRMSAWDIESRLLEQSRASESGFYDDMIGVRKNVFSVYHGVEKGKWYPSVLKKLKRSNPEIVIQREVMPIYDELIEYFKTELSALLSPRIRIFIKSVIKKLGVKFVSES